MDNPSKRIRMDHDAFKRIFSRRKRLIWKHLGLNPLSWIPTSWPRPTYKKFLKYVTTQLRTQIPGDPPPRKIILDVDFAWRNHLYVIGRVVRDKAETLHFEGELTWGIREKEFRGQLVVKELPAAKPVSEATREALWKEYDYHIGLYKYYLTTGLNANIFFFAITGAILAFIYKDQQSPRTGFSPALLLPLLINISLGVVFIYGWSLWKQITWTVKVIKRQLEIKRAPDIQILSVLLLAFGIIYFAVAALLVLLILSPSFFRG